MLSRIKEFFEQQLSTDSKLDDQQATELAAAALLIEISRADFEQTAEEIAATQAALKKRFNLSDEALNNLVDLAQAETENATSLYDFTSLVNDHYSLEQKYALVKAMWEVANADGDICKYEDHLIRRTANLIYLPHSQFIQAKLEVLGQ
jgi:uncharacterized tellurite resistance protein B-like protein